MLCLFGEYNLELKQKEHVNVATRHTVIAACASANTQSLVRLEPVYRVATPHLVDELGGVTVVTVGVAVVTVGVAVVTVGVAVVAAGVAVVVAGVAVVVAGVAVVVAGVVEEDDDVVAEEDDAQTVLVVGEIVKAVTVKSGVAPTVHVQHGSPNASPLVMSMVMSEVLNAALQKSVVHVIAASEKALAKSVYCDESSFGWPSACSKLSPFGIFFRYDFKASVCDAESTMTAAMV